MSRKKVCLSCIKETAWIMPRGINRKEERIRAFPETLVYDRRKAAVCKPGEYGLGPGKAEGGPEDHP